MKKTSTLVLITFLLALYTSGIRAQLALYNDGALLYSSRNSMVHVAGDIANKYTSTIQNDGVIELTGNFTNDSTAQFTTGADNTSTERAFKFIGSGTQSINGNISDTTLRYFYNLIIDKPVSASTIIMETQADVKGSLVFGSSTSGAATYTPTANSTLTNNAAKGLIRTFDTLNTDHELYITNPSVNAIQGYASLFINNPATDSFIQTRGAQAVGAGGLSRNVSTTGVQYIFPVATSLNGYNATGFTFSNLGSKVDKVRGMFVDAPSGVGSLAKYCSGCTSTYPGTTGFNYYFSEDPCLGNVPKWIILDQLPSSHGYWSFAGSSADQYSMVAYPYYPSWTSNSQNWRTIQKAGSITSVPTGDWSTGIPGTLSTPTDLLSYTLNTACYTGAGVPGGSYTGFSNYQMARSMAGGELPVELVSLTAEAMENEFIRIEWATASEVDNMGFGILRSTNGYDYSRIGWVAASGDGNNTSTTNYQYDDMTAQAGIVYYYKLDQEDHDGNSKETYIVQAQLTLHGSLTMSCFPNPAHISTNVQIITAADMNLSLGVYNMAGQLVQTNEVQATPGENNLEINTAKLPSGLYDIVLRSAGNVFTNTLNIIH